jgi:hypothetical protein
MADEPEDRGGDRGIVATSMVTDRPNDSFPFVIAFVVRVRLHISMSRFGDLACSTQDEDEETNSLYESIGSKLLEWCDRRPHGVPSIHHLYHTNAIQGLDDIMTCPIASLPRDGRMKYQNSQSLFAQPSWLSMEGGSVDSC